MIDQCDDRLLSLLPWQGRRTFFLSTCEPCKQSYKQEPHDRDKSAPISGNPFSKRANPGLRPKRVGQGIAASAAHWANSLPVGNDPVVRQANAADDILLGNLGVDNARPLWVTHVCS
jgi:hypothetical protein